MWLLSGEKTGRPLLIPNPRLPKKLENCEAPLLWCKQRISAYPCWEGDLRALGCPNVIPTWLGSLPCSHPGPFFAKGKYQPHSKSIESLWSFPKVVEKQRRWLPQTSLLKLLFLPPNFHFPQQLLQLFPWRKASSQTLLHSCGLFFQLFLLWFFPPFAFPPLCLTRLSHNSGSYESAGKEKRKGAKIQMLRTGRPLWTGSA